MNFVVDNQFVNRVETWNHEWVDTWYHKYYKLNIRSDVAIMNRMNRIKAACTDVLTDISINCE